MEPVQQPVRVEKQQIVAQPIKPQTTVEKVKAFSGEHKDAIRNTLIGAGALAGTGTVLGGGAWAVQRFLRSRGSAQPNSKEEFNSKSLPTQEARQAAGDEKEAQQAAEDLGMDPNIYAKLMKMVNTHPSRYTLSRLSEAQQAAMYELEQEARQAAGDEKEAQQAAVNEVSPSEEVLTLVGPLGRPNSDNDVKVNA